MNAPTPKYRPVLSASHITHIIALCKRDMSAESLRVISILSPFQYKIENESVTPAYTEQPKLTELDKLGFAEPIETTANLRYSTENVANLYAVWKQSPGSLNLNQLKQVKEFMYENDLMTPAEESEYERSLIKSE